MNSPVLSCSIEFLIGLIDLILDYWIRILILSIRPACNNIVYFFIGLILLLGMTFFSPSATIKSPSIKPETTSTFPLY